MTPDMPTIKIVDGKMIYDPDALKNCDCSDDPLCDLPPILAVPDTTGYLIHFRAGGRLVLDYEQREEAKQWWYVVAEDGHGNQILTSVRKG